MTRNSFAGLTLAALAALGLAATDAHAQTTIVAYNFDSTSTAAPTSVTPSTGAATFTNNFTTPSADVVFQSGPVGNKTSTSATGDYAIRLNGGTGTSPSDSTKQLEEGKYVQFAFSTVGYNNIDVTYLTQRSNSGFTTQTFQYSTDGTSFTTFATHNPTLAGTVAGNYNADFNLSSITGINNDANAAFRIVFTGSIASQSVTSNDRIDDLSVTGQAIAAAPEPSSVAGMVVGIGAVALLVARRRKVVNF